MQNDVADLWFHKPKVPSVRLRSFAIKVLKLVGGKQRNSPIFRILCSIINNYPAKSRGISPDT